MMKRRRRSRKKTRRKRVTIARARMVVIAMTQKRKRPKQGNSGSVSFISQRALMEKAGETFVLLPIRRSLFSMSYSRWRWLTKSVKRN